MFDDISPEHGATQPVDPFESAHPLIRAMGEIFADQLRNLSPDDFGNLPPDAAGGDRAPLAPIFPSDSGSDALEIPTNWVDTLSERRNNTASFLAKLDHLAPVGGVERVPEFV